jgi:uncharacterized protein YcaQ
VNTLTPAHARRIILRAQGLDGGWSLPPGVDGAAEAIDRLGYVQIDTIAVIERAHHHVLWTRHRNYAAGMLDDLLSRDRRVFEFWTHAASYIPLRDYRLYLPKMRAFARRPAVRTWVKANRGLLRHVLDRIRTEGPLRSADFARPPQKRGPWWDWSPTKRALEILYWSGELMIAGRRNFQRVYDLTERVLPAEIDTSLPRPREVARYVARRTLGAQGIVTAREAAWWLKDRKPVAAALQELVDAGEAAEVRIAGEDGTPYFVTSAALDSDLDPRPELDTVRLLSPFDNLITDRARALRFFDFDYRMECYTPEAKRKYGYFTLPILWGDRLVGRLDPKADRKAGRFIVRGLVLEPGFVELDGFATALGSALREFADFHGCEGIAVENPGRVDGRVLKGVMTSST